MAGDALIINPGSTSTKVALFDKEHKVAEEIIRHDGPGLARFDNVTDQFDYRMEMIDRWLDSLSLPPGSIQVVVGRGAPLRPLEGGSYEISQQMLDDLKSMRYSNHASNLGAIIASHLGKRFDIPAMISDPVTVDNFTDVARVSGLPEIERVAALQQGRVVDVNDALLGMGPFSPDRAGALPIGGLVKLCYSGRYTEKEMIDMLSKKSGLVAYIGKSDLREVEQMIHDGSDEARLYFNAMAYQIAKEIGSAACVLKGELEAIVLTGGMAHSVMLVDEIRQYISFLGRIAVVPGEFEMEALAAAGQRYLTGHEGLKHY